MSIEFLCQACGAKLWIADDQAGKPVKCPQCSAVVQASAAGETASERPFGGTEPAPAPADEPNPYASPAAPPHVDVTAQSVDDPPVLTPGILAAMSQTRLWVLFVSILGFLAGAMIALVAVGMVIGATFTREYELLILAPIYLLGAILYLAGAYYLFVYGRRIGVLEHTNRVHDLESSLVAQKSFWKLVGITLALMLVLWLIGAALMVLVTMAAGMR